VSQINDACLRKPVFNFKKRAWLVIIKMYQIQSLISFLRFLIFNNVKVYDKNVYKIGCEKSSRIALKIFYDIHYLLRIDNIKNHFLYRPISNLKYNKLTIDQSLYFLDDCIEFSKNERIIFQNEKLKHEIKNARHLINKLYLNIDKKVLPAQPNKNLELGLKIKRQELIHQQNMDLSEIIYWRTKYMWNHYYAQHKSKMNIKITYQNNAFNIQKQYI
jgi:hypothetical protein